MNIFGHWHTWLLLGSAWVALAALTVLAFSVIARVGAWRERRGGK